MNVYLCVNIVNARYGKNNYWLEFEAYVDSMDKTKKYIIEFCGTELNTCIPLSVGRYNALKDKLLNDYGYGPYDLLKVKSLLENNKFYHLK